MNEFVFPAAVWDVRWRVEAYSMSSDMQIATVMAKRKTQESENAQHKKICIHSTAAVSHLCLHAI